MSRPLRTPALLAAGSVVSGLLAYLLFALVTRGLGATPAAPVSVLWTLWALAGAAFTFPLQHWITRSVVAGMDPAMVAPAGGRFGTDDRPTLNWILFHVLQEYARHAGHLDVARELIDGATGE